jgi:hypothetical protein
MGRRRPARGTVQDYGHFVQAWLNDGAGILSVSAVQMALQDQLGQSSCRS